MILGLTALGEGSMPTRMLVRMSIAHAAGGVVGGGAAAATIWLALTPVRTLLPGVVAEVIVAAVALTAVLVDVKVLKVHAVGGQVPPEWYARYGPERSYAMYGLVLGSAFGTFRPYASVYAVFAALGFLVPLELAVLSGAAYGFARTAVIGPASLAATPIAKLLYLHPPKAAWATLSIAVTCLVLLMALGLQS